MRHTVLLFIGDDLRHMSEAVKRYALMYGADQVLPFFNVVSVHKESESGAWQLDKVAWQESASTGFDSDLEGRYAVEVRPEKTLSTDPAVMKTELSDYFRQLHSSLVTVQNRGSNSELLVSAFLPLSDTHAKSAEVDVFANIVHSLTDQMVGFDIDVTCFCPDLNNVLGMEDQEGVTRQEILSAAKTALINIVNLKKAFDALDRQTHFNHIIAYQNVNEQGISLNFDAETIAGVIGEFALRCTENYSRVFVDNFDQERLVFAAGCSVLRMDKYYYVHYLLRRAYLHVMDRERVMEEKVDAHSVSLRADAILKPHLGLFNNFWNAQVDPQLKDSKLTQQVVVANVTPAMDEQLSHITTQLQACIKDENMSLPEKQAILAQLLGEDDSLLSGYVFNNQLISIDDLFTDSVEHFVTLENADIEHFVSQHKDEQPIRVLNEPLNEDGKVVSPLQYMKALRAQMKESTQYIRKKTTELEQLNGQLEDAKEIEQHLNGNLFQFGGGRFRLNTLEDKVLEDEYVAHAVTEKAVDLRSGFAPIKTQGEQGACVAFAVASMMEYQYKRFFKEDVDLSEAFMYYTVRKKDGNEQKDEGTTFYDMIHNVSDTGVCLENSFPYDARVFDKEPSPVAYEEAHSRLIKSAKSVQVGVEHFKSALVDGYPIGISMKMFESFDATKGFVNWPTQTELESSCGFHAMVVVGYSDEQKVFVVRNSWGDKFGRDGYCYIPYSFVSDEKAKIVRNAYIITNVSLNGNEIGELTPKANIYKQDLVVDFTVVDADIQAGVIRNLIQEEQRKLEVLSEKYYFYRSQYEKLVQTLCNNANRTLISNRSLDRMANSINATKELYAQAQNERSEDLQDKKKRYMKGEIALLLTALAVTACPFIISYYIESWPDELWLILGAGILLFVLLIVVFFHYRAQIRKAEVYWEERLGQINSKISKLQRESNILGLRCHIAGMVLDKMHSLKNEIHTKYLETKAFVGTLKQWHKEESEKVEGMDANLKAPFYSVLSNKKLDAYFDQQKDALTAGICLYDYIDKFKVNQSSVVQFQNGLKQSLVDILLNQISDFKLSDYLMGKSYPYLDPLSSEQIEAIFTNLEEGSNMCLQYKEGAIGEDKSEHDRVMLCNYDLSQDNNWASLLRSKCFSAPRSEQMSSAYALVEMQLKRLKENHLAIVSYN